MSSRRASLSKRSPRSFLVTPRLAAHDGHALLTTMMAAACLVPLAAFTAMQARLDWMVQNHTRIALQTFTVADSGLEHALADLEADPRFDRLLDGPDRRAGTGDDGEYPFLQPPPEFFPHAPFRYEVRVARSGADALVITARGFGPLNAIRTVLATVARAATPFLAGALSLAARGAALALGSDFSIAGAAATAGDPGLPAVALDGVDAAAALAARLEPDAAARLVGRGGSPSIAAVALPSAEALADAAAHRVEAQALSGEAYGALGDGLFFSPGSLRLTDVSGSGVLVAAGPLEISGVSNFSGIVIALGDLRTDLGSSVTIDGAVLVGRLGSASSLRSSGHIAYDPLVIARVDAALPGLLPRRARVTGWREQPDD
jgi:hypothetical protein